MPCTHSCPFSCPPFFSAIRRITFQLPKFIQAPLFPRLFHPQVLFPPCPEVPCFSGDALRCPLSPKLKASLFFIIAFVHSECTGPFTLEHTASPPSQGPFVQHSRYVPRSPKTPGYHPPHDEHDLSQSIPPLPPVTPPSGLWSTPTPLPATIESLQQLFPLLCITPFHRVFQSVISFFSPPPEKVLSSNRCLGELDLLFLLLRFLPRQRFDRRLNSGRSTLPWNSVAAADPPPPLMVDGSPPRVRRCRCPCRW